MNRWVGVAIALVGTVVVAPDGTWHLLGTISGQTQRRGRQLRGYLAQVLPFLRRDITVHVVPATATAMTTQFTVTAASAWVWRPNALVDERFDLLREQIADVARMVNEANTALNQEREQRQAAVAGLQEQLQQAVAALNRRLDKQQHDDAAIDARGLPVIGLGVVLSGIPDELASIPLGLGWAFPVIGMLAAAAAVTGAWREHASEVRVLASRLGARISWRR